MPTPTIEKSNTTWKKEAIITVEALKIFLEASEKYKGLNTDLLNAEMKSNILL